MDQKQKSNILLLTMTFMSVMLLYFFGRFVNLYDKSFPFQHLLIILGITVVAWFIIIKIKNSVQRVK